MASDKEKVQGFARLASRPRPPSLSSRVFPPLPPLSPPDADDNSRLRKTSPPPPAPKLAASWSQTNQSAGACAEQPIGSSTSERAGVGEGEVLQLFPSSLEKDALQIGRTIWSVTPEELSALEEEMINWKTPAAEPSTKTSYAEVSKRNLPGFVANLVEQMKTEEDVEQPRRTFKKYYGLPVFIPSGPHQHDLEAHEEKEAPTTIGLPPSLRSKPSNMLARTRDFALSAETPTFYPRQTSDSSELIQMLKVSLSSKKVAPHMDWWPGDWKCTNCGNHNFSYRDACKRCRVGRQEDAGFVFPPSPIDPST